MDPPAFATLCQREGAVLAPRAYSRSNRKRCHPSFLRVRWYEAVALSDGPTRGGVAVGWPRLTQCAVSLRVRQCSVARVYGSAWRRETFLIQSAVWLRRSWTVRWSRTYAGRCFQPSSLPAGKISG